MHFAIGPVTCVMENEVGRLEFMVDTLRIIWIIVLFFTLVLTVYPWPPIHFSIPTLLTSLKVSIKNKFTLYTLFVVFREPFKLTFSVVLPRHELADIAKVVAILNLCCHVAKALLLAVLKLAIVNISSLIDVDPTAMELILAEESRVFFGDPGCSALRLNPLNDELPLTFFFVVLEHALEIVKSAAVIQLGFALDSAVPFFDIVDERTLVNEFIEPELASLVVLLALLQVTKILMPIFLEDAYSLVR